MEVVSLKIVELPAKPAGFALIVILVSVPSLATLVTALFVAVLHL
jgi:hypothetical protein